MWVSYKLHIYLDAYEKSASYFHVSSSVDWRKGTQIPLSFNVNLF